MHTHMSCASAPAQSSTQMACLPCIYIHKVLHIYNHTRTHIAFSVSRWTSGCCAQQCAFVVWRHVRCVMCLRTFAWIWTSFSPNDHEHYTQHQHQQRHTHLSAQKCAQTTTYTIYCIHLMRTCVLPGCIVPSFNILATLCQLQTTTSYNNSNTRKETYAQPIYMSFRRHNAPWRRCSIPKERWKKTKYSTWIGTEQFAIHDNFRTSTQQMYATRKRTMEQIVGQKCDNGVHNICAVQI